MDDGLLLLSTEDCGRYGLPGHPEHPQRVLATLKRLRSFLPEAAFRVPTAATREDVLAVHRPDLLERVEGEETLDPDTPGMRGIFPAALLSAGSAMEAAQEALAGRRAFSLMRPPGHHATPSSGMGFCYFNSIAVAARRSVDSGKAGKVAVLDLDCHHGNGTEACFLGRPGLLYASLHQFPCYPGTGSKSMDNCLNWPLAPGTGEGGYFPALDAALERIRAFKPDVLGVSMGFDTYRLDPLTQFGLERSDYRRIGKALRETGLPTFGILEGGYHDDLPALVEEFLEGWTV
jgi:acetoin utilization deacetylase AcuC-like enzyme